MKCFFRLSLLASVPARAPTPNYPDHAGASIEILPSSCSSETRCLDNMPLGTGIRLLLAASVLDLGRSEALHRRLSIIRP